MGGKIHQSVVKQGQKIIIYEDDDLPPHHTQLDYPKSLPQFTSIRKAQNNDSYFHCNHLMYFYEDLISIFLVQPEAPQVFKFCILIE